MFNKFVSFIAISLIFVSCLSTPKPSTAASAEQSVHQMILDGQGQQIKDRFQTRVDVNLTDSEGNTPLHAAAQANDAEITAYLIFRGANTELKNNAGETPLFTAIKNKSTKAALALINGGANIFAVNGVTAVEAALKNNSVFYETFLNQKTANAKDSEGNTVVHYLVKMLDSAAIEAAIAQKMPLSTENAEKITPLLLAYSNAKDIKAVKVAATLLLGNAIPAYGDFTYFETAVKTRNPNIRFNEGQTPLHIAAINGHSGIVDYLLERGAQAQAKDVSGATALHFAVRNGDITIAKKLLEAKSNPNSADSSEKTPLLVIIPNQNRLQMYDLLLSNGANPKAKDMYGDSALHIATMLNSDIDILKKLTDYNADIDERNKKGMTPLAVAIDTKNKTHAEFYVNAGADIHSEDLNGNTPLIRSFKAGDILFKTIVKRTNVGLRDSYGNTPLHIAVQNNAPNAYLTYLLELGADVNARNRSGDTALAIAVEKNYKEIGELLLSHNADVFGTNAKNYSPLHSALEKGGERRDWLLSSSVVGATDGIGNTPLHYAAGWKYDEAVLFIIQKGANINARNANGEIPLYSAVKSDSPSTIDILLQRGSNKENRDFLGNTPLHTSTRWGAQNAANTLIKSGADINAQNLAGKTPLAESIRVGNMKMAILFLDRGANPNIIDAVGKTVVSDAIQNKNTEALALLLKRGASVNIQDMYGRNAYHEAALSQDIGIINLIASTGANPFSRDSFGKTPFSLVLNATPEAIKAVLSSAKEAMDSDGNTPLHIAVNEHASKETLNLLIDMKYPLNSRNRMGFTPLLIAVSNSDYDNALILLNAGSDPFLADNSGNSPLSLILSSAPENLIELTRSIGLKTDMSGEGVLHYAARTADEKTVKTLLSMGFDKNVKNISDETPYDIAVRWQRKPIAELLK